MDRDPKAFLWDIRMAAEAILEFTAGRTCDGYLGDRLLRSAGERQFEIIGEAVNRLCKLDSQWTNRIPSAPQIVAFRNLLIHGYASVDDATVWATIEQSLPPLLIAVTGLLNQEAIAGRSP